jgi:hypothetical protein
LRSDWTVRPNGNTMKKHVLLWATALLCGTGAMQLNAQNCNNVGFEDGDFNNWLLSEGFVPNTAWTVVPTGPYLVDQTVISTQHASVLTIPGIDPNCINPNSNQPDPCMTYVSPLGGNCIRLGNQNVGAETEKIEYSVFVTAQNAGFVYAYSVVLEDPFHTATEQPRFSVQVLDQNGQVIPGPCGTYDVYAGSDPSFITSPGGTPKYKCWTVVGLDLTPYIGQTMTIVFQTSDCTLGGHYGYAYVDASCSNLEIDVNFCPGNTQVLLVAPSGYTTYQWYDPQNNPIPGATGDTLVLSNPQVNSQYSVQMTSVAGCPTTLLANLQYSVITAQTATTNITCWNADDGSLASSCNDGIPPYTYSWNTSATSATINNLGPGEYIVLITDSLGCEDYDTIQIVEPPRLDTTGVTTEFCVGDEQITLNGVPGFASYAWYDADSNLVSSTVDLVINNPQMGSSYDIVYQTAPSCPVYETYTLGLVPPANLFLPDSLVNVFTPNNDGKNDYFYPYYDNTIVNQQASTSQPAYDFALLYVATYEVWVYDRWGIEVFYSNDYTFGWDGRVNGKDASDGVYYYVTRFTSRCKEESEPIEHNGFVHLMRN